MDTNIPWGIHRLRDMVGDSHTSTCDRLGAFVRAVPLPYDGNLRERLIAAWWVLTGRAYATTWPKAGDLERALGIYKAPKPR